MEPTDIFESSQNERKGALGIQIDSLAKQLEPVTEHCEDLAGQDIVAACSNCALDAQVRRTAVCYS
jgi:hypothetical protein